MRAKCKVWLVAACMANMAAVGMGQAAPVEETPNAMMVRQAELVLEAGKLDKVIKGAWGDKRFSSEEVDALREKYERLQWEMLATQAELAKKVQELPEVKAMVERRDKANAEAAALKAKVDTLMGAAQQ